MKYSCNIFLINTKLFQGGVNLFLNGIVLGTLYYGGYLLSNQRVTPGDLMSFLVATQTIQRSLQQMSLLFGQIIKGAYNCESANFTKDIIDY